MSVNERNLVKPRQKINKYSPYTRIQRKERREEVYRLHFENGMPATRISQLMKVDRNTINNDLKVLYNKAISNKSDTTFDDVIDSQLVRLETQRDRLGLYLSDSKDVNTTITIERMIADIDFKIIGLMERLNQSKADYWESVLTHVNKIAEDENLKLRFTTPNQLYRISLQSKQDLDKLREKVLGLDKPKEDNR